MQRDVQTVQREVAASLETMRTQMEKTVTQVIQTQKNTFAQISSGLKTEGFLSTFSLYDILWFGLGGLSAFKLGAGMGNR